MLLKPLPSRLWVDHLPRSMAITVCMKDLPAQRLLPVLCSYIRRFVPVLRNMPAKYIYEPWTAPKVIQGGTSSGEARGKDEGRGVGKSVRQGMGM